jgi:Transposase DDE domain
MTLPSPELDKRLQHRYQQLVQEHLGQAKTTSAGPRPLPSDTTAFAATQAAWRFYRNPRLNLPRLVQPLVDFAHTATAKDCQDYLLMVHDWSHVDYVGHHSKQDRLFGTHPGEVGYELQVALAVSDRTGCPLAPVYLGLQAADGVHDSRFATLQQPDSNLDGLLGLFDHLQKLEWQRPVVHIIDREADSVGHFRAWQKAGHLFLVRVDDRLVRSQGQECLLSAVVERLQAQGAFRFSREVEYHGRPARQEVAEAAVELHREAWRTRIIDGKKKKWRVYGKALPLRLVVSRVYSRQGELLAEWWLLTNVPTTVLAATVALWYYWRWRIESYFKLLKSAGLELEHWQQEKASAIARRLLVAGMACAWAWHVARDPTPAGSTLRRLLVRLSGRQMGRGVEYTDPALVAGMWVLLAMLETLEQYSLADLQRLATLILPRPQSSNSS